MSTTDNNPQELPAKTPTEVVNAFFEANSVDNVKLTLLIALQGYALNERKGFLDIELTDEQITGMFDSLVNLVGAVETLIEEGKIEGLKG